MTGKRAIKGVLRRRGFEITRVPELPLGHSLVRPHATYSPWEADAEFRRVYGAVADSTLVDRFRCYALWQLVEEVSTLPRGDILEVGVWRGGTGCLMATRAAVLNLPGATFLCDTFSGVVKAGGQDPHYEGGEHEEATPEGVNALAEELEVEVEILLGVFPEDTGAAIEDHAFRLCHIDVDVYLSARDCLQWVFPRLVSGGILVFDDYGFWTCPGITRLVNEQRGKPDRTVLHNLNGQGIVIKR